MHNLNKSGFLSALGTLIYIIIIATLIQNGNTIFGSEDNFISPIIFLLLFTMSALIVGGLILGKPLTLYIDGAKKEAVSLFMTTVGWMAGFTIVTIIVALLLR